MPRTRRQKKEPKRKTSKNKAARKRELAEATNRPLRQLLWWLNNQQGIDDKQISARTGWGITQLEAIRTGKWQTPASAILEVRFFILISSFTEDTPRQGNQLGIPAHFKVPRLHHRELNPADRDNPQAILQYYRDCAFTPRIIQHLTGITGGDYIAAYMGNDNLSAATKRAIIKSYDQHTDYFF